MRSTCINNLYIYFRLHENSKHWKFWEKIESEIKKWKFLKNKGKFTIPSIRHIGSNIKAIRILWKTCRAKGFEYLLTRSLNQDPLENAIGRVRAHCGGNDTPSSHLFHPAFVSTVLESILKMQDKVDTRTGNDLQTTNCEDDDASMAPLKPYLLEELFGVSINLQK